MSSRRTPLAARIAVALFAAGTTITASLPSLADSSHQPAILGARAEGSTLRIVGFDLGGATPRVTLGGVSLAIATATATQIDALLPAGIAPGSYLLTLAVGPGSSVQDNSKYDESWVTIGAVGPQGATGPQGPAGKDGSAGPAGPSGAPGAAGPAGALGATGPQGPAGPAGALGSTGPQGPAGARGATGSQGPAGPTGAPGAAGPAGAIGPAGPVGPAGSTGVPTSFVVQVVRYFESGEPSSVRIRAECPAGSAVVSGGAGSAYYDSVNDGMVGNGWDTAGTATIFASPWGFLMAKAVCLRIS